MLWKFYRIRTIEIWTDWPIGSLVTHIVSLRWMGLKIRVALNWMSLIPSFLLILIMLERDTCLKHITSQKYPPEILCSHFQTLFIPRGKGAKKKVQRGQERKLSPSRLHPSCLSILTNGILSKEIMIASIGPMYLKWNAMVPNCIH